MRDTFSYVILLTFDPYRKGRHRRFVVRLQRPATPRFPGALAGVRLQLGDPPRSQFHSRLLKGGQAEGVGLLQPAAEEPNHGQGRLLRARYQLRRA
jgi:hypothetical protein